MKFLAFQYRLADLRNISLVLALLFSGTTCFAQSSGPSNGIRLGNSGFTLGGYGEMVYADPRGEDWRLAADSLSALLSWDGGGRLSFFAEVEFQDALVIAPGDVTTDDLEVISERLYFDYALRDELKFRLGKFLTPIGRWNQIHAAPLTWTTTRPLITEQTFPTNATGGMVYGLLPWLSEGVEYWLYTSPGEEIFAEKELDTFREAIGLRVAATLFPHTNIGLSLVSFEQVSEGNQHKELYGLDFEWAYRRFEFSGEFAYRSLASAREDRDEQGAYLQLVSPLYKQLFAVFRYESFHRQGENQDLNLYLGGLTWRVKPGMVFKGEYVGTTDNEANVPDGFFASFAVLF